MDVLINKYWNNINYKENLKKDLYEKWKPKDVISDLQQDWRVLDALAILKS